MLPEILSNGICSLQPQQKRFAKSAYITYDQNANIISRSFADSIICSTQRLTYQQADKILKGHTKDTSPEVIELLKNMETLSRAIESRRTKNGMLHLDLPETELVMDKSGRVVDALPADDSYPHTMIEMFMVEANDAVAVLLDRLNIPFMRRIHPEPDSLSMKNLGRLVKAFGYTLPRNPDRKTMQDLLASVQGKDCSLAVNLAVLRSFEKAQYAPLNMGHFALASTHYCHFTSPIRRYADLLVHRVLEFYLQNNIETAKQQAATQDLTEIGKQITFTEQRAEDAERELKTVLILQLLSKKINQELDCIVTGLTNFGVFVQCKKFGIEGLIRMNDLGPDHWQYDDKTQSIVGQNSGSCVRMGQSLKVKIVSVNIPARQLNLSPVELLTKKAKQKTKKSPKRKYPKKRKR
jgi:ribonuclease R